MRDKYNGGEWTVSRFNSFVKGALRSASIKWPPKYKCLNAAKVGKKINWKTNRIAEHYKCNSCLKEFPAKEVQVDHIKPVIDPTEGFINWDTVINNMFCEADNLQVVCKPCHLIKTKAEKLQAKERKENGK